MTDTTTLGPVLAADGTPLKKSLNRALRLSKIRALALIAPLLIFVLVTFIAPIADMLFRSVENDIVGSTLPRTVAELETWDADLGAPEEPVFKALYHDMFRAVEAKNHTKRRRPRRRLSTTPISYAWRSRRTLQRKTLGSWCTLPCKTI